LAVGIPETQRRFVSGSRLAGGQGGDPTDDSFKIDQLRRRLLWNKVLFVTNQNRIQEETGMPLDETDKQIAELLYANGRLNHEQIAKAVNLSRTAVYERVKRLERTGAIRGYKALLDWDALGYPVTACILVQTVGASFTDTFKTIMNLDYSAAVAEEGYRLTGEWCLLLKVRAVSPLALQDVIDRVRAVPGVQATMTSVVLSTLFENRPPQATDELG
jgi:Lrp/AsnC family leucine-responsive transcriptional regulator